jgi:putative ABC transport system substrate-binding protein
LEVYGKRLQFLGETVRNLKNVRMLLAQSWMELWRTTLGPLREDAGRAGVEIAAAWVGGDLNRPAYEQAFDAMAKDRVDGLIVGDSAENLTNRHLIVDLAAVHRLPAIYPFREFVEVGGLFSYGSDVAGILRRVADMTDRILRGAKPADIPFSQPIKLELVLNRKTAKLLGIEFQTALLAAADEVIE